MNFAFLKFFPVLILLFVIFIYLIKRQEKQYFLWIKKIWFLERSKLNLVANFFYLISFFFLIVSFLDLRGKEETIKTSIPDQKTIIVIDASASMLTEDVRPNRFKKSLLLAKHFVKNAVGHQIAVILFSDTHRKLVPFTDDIDLLGGRIDALAETDIRYGGSNISLAIKESLQYFRNSSTKLENVQGNILVFTDSEENGDGIKIDVPVGINLGVVGVGTNKGGRIPLRDKRRNFRGYKKYNGKEVISKLDEDSLKKMGNNIKSYKYWIALSYSVPTLEIIQFFRKIHKSNINQGDVRVRPVKSFFLLIPFVLFFVFSIFLKRFKTFKFCFLLFFILTNVQSLKVLASENKEDRKKPAISIEIQKKMNILKKGNASLDEKWKLAELYLKSGDAKSALIIFDENINSLGNISAGTLLNYGTALLMDGKIKKGSLLFLELKKDLEKESSKKSRKMLEVMARNTLLALKKNDQEKKKEKKKKEEEKKKEKNKKKDEGKKDNKKENKGKEDSKKEEKKGKEQKDDQKNKKDDKQKEQKNKGNEKKKEEGEEKESQKNKEEKKDNKKEKENNKKEKKNSQTLEEKEAEIKKKRKMTKLPAILKQILNEDRSLQKKKQKTSIQGNRNKKKDW